MIRPGHKGVRLNAQLDEQLVSAVMQRGGRQWRGAMRGASMESVDRRKCGLAI